MEICPVGAELFLADEQTDRHDDANSLFSQFCEGAWKVVCESWHAAAMELVCFLFVPSVGMKCRHWI